MDFNKVVESIKKDAPKFVKENKGALIGAVVGLFLTDNKAAQSSILGAVAGATFVDNKKDEKSE